MATTRPALLRRMSFHYSDVQLADVITAMKDPITGIKLKDKRYFLKAYAKCFTGVDAVNWLAQHLKISRKDAEKLGQILLTRHYIHHISYKHHFEDKYIFFKFNEGQYQPDALEAPFHKFPDLLRNGEVDFVVLFKMMIDEENGVEVRPRKKGLKSYSNCFVGSELVSWLSVTFQLSRNISVDIGAKFMADGYISHVTESYPFADDHFFYRFNYEMALTKSNRRRLSIGLALASFWLQSDGKPFKESLMDISYRIGTKSVNTKAYIILENDGLNIFETSSKTKHIAKILLQNIVRIHRSVVRNSFTITTQLQQKLMIFNSNPEILGDWQLAVDAFKYPNHFSGSCMDISEKTQLLRSLFYDGYKGGLIKSSDDEEWTYTNGLLSMADNIRKSLVVAYKWDGQILSNANDADHEEVGRWDGVRIAWMDGTHEEPDSSLAYIFHEGEYQNQDPSLNWKFSRHFLVSVSDGHMFWAINGSVPPPVVMFLQLMRTKKQMVAHFNSVMSSVSVTVSENIPVPSPIIETV